MVVMCGMLTMPRLVLHYMTKKIWFSKLLSIGPSYGYYPEPKKCALVVSSDHLTNARELFNSYGVTVTTSHRLLGRVIGDHSGSVDYVRGCVNGWITMIEKLVLIAQTQPQVSYSAYTRSIQSQWTFLQSHSRLWFTF